MDKFLVKVKVKEGYGFPELEGKIGKITAYYDKDGKELENIIEDSVAAVDVTFDSGDFLFETSYLNIISSIDDMNKYTYEELILRPTVEVNPVFGNLKIDSDRRRVWLLNRTVTINSWVDGFGWEASESYIV